MEVPQSIPYGTEGRKATHDFLSLYNHSTVQQDPRPPSSQGNFLKTHDFLGKTSSKEESKVEISATQKSPPQESAQMVEHILPGGIGTYSISHISYFNQKVPKPEGTIFPMAQTTSTDKNDHENSNCSSYTGSGFTLWEEPAVNKGKTREENTAASRERLTGREPATKLGQWTPEKPSSSTNNHPYSFSCSSSQASGQKQSFLEMIKSAKGSSYQEESEDGEDFTPKKESSVSVTPPQGELRVKVVGKNQDQRANTPRSKHSATEQRRRSKINDRFQKLREIIPFNDQKRDKASFLLEVIEYIQFLQEKVHRYEGSYPGWKHEAANVMPWGNNQRSLETSIDQSRNVINGSGSHAMLFAANLDQKNVVPTTVPECAQEQHRVFNTSGSGVIAYPTARQPSNAADNTASQPLSQTQTPIAEHFGANDKLKGQDLAIEGGTISISSVYSQGLLNTLTKSLQSSGVDLSQASVSVQVEIGKRATSRSSAPVYAVKGNEFPSGKQGTIGTRYASSEGSDQPLKKLRVGMN